MKEYTVRGILETLGQIQERVLDAGSYRAGFFRELKMPLRTPIVKPFPGKWPTRIFVRWRETPTRGLPSATRTYLGKPCSSRLSRMIRSRDKIMTLLEFDRAGIFYFVHDGLCWQDEIVRTLYHPWDGVELREVGPLARMKKVAQIPKRVRVGDVVFPYWSRYQKVSADRLEEFSSWIKSSGITKG